jgi:beta-xylosidase
VFSSSDLLTWQEHPVPLKREDFKWTKDGDQAWAAHVTERNGKFYMYVTIANFTSPTKKIGVAVADTPVGPFQDAIGAPLIEKSFSLDPAVFIDDDGQAYIFGGYGQCFYAKLKENMIELASPIATINVDNYLLGPWVHKHKDWYYLSYSQGVPSKIVYAMSKNINGPWEYKGLLNEVPGNTSTNHHAILPDFKGKSYFFYHNGVLPGGSSMSRSVCIDYLYYNSDGTMKKVWMTSEGIKE